MAAGLPGTILEGKRGGEEHTQKKSFHCVLLLITCLGSEGLNWVRVGEPWCWEGGGGGGVTESVKDSRPASLLKT